MRKNQKRETANEMNQFKRWVKCGAALAALFLCSKAQAIDANTFDDYLVGAPILTPVGPLPGNGTPYQVNSSTVGMVAASTPTVYFATNESAYISAQTIVSSDTIATQTLTSGKASTGTFTVVSFTALSSATASSSLTISSNGVAALQGSCVSGGAVGLGAFNVCNPANWTVGTSSAATACSLAAAINSFNVVQATCTVGVSAGVVFTTAPYYGSAWNNFTINASSPTAISTNAFTGGRDNQNITVNGVTFAANRDFYPVTSAAQTATNIATAITASSTTTNVVASAGGTGSVVYATTTVVGANTNYTITSSSNAALSILPLTSSSAVTGAAVGALGSGANASFTINSTTITLASHGFNVGLPVLYSGATAIAGLTTQTTYYITNVTPTTFGLASSSTNSVSGLAITITSSATPTTANTYTLAPLAITGTPAYKWVVSNDQTTWVPFTTTLFNITVPSVSLGAYNSTGTVTSWDLGHVGYGYVGIQITPPTTGALNFKAKVIGKPQ